MRIMPAILMAALVIAGTACAVQRQREQIRAGLLTRGLHQEAFLGEWGFPANTYTASGEDVLRIFVAGGFGGSFYKGKAPLEVWEYPARGTVLVFDRQRLVTWRTPATPAQVTAPELGAAPRGSTPGATAP